MQLTIIQSENKKEFLFFIKIHNFRPSNNFSKKKFQKIPDKKIFFLRKGPLYTINKRVIKAKIEKFEMQN